MGKIYDPNDIFIKFTTWHLLIILKSYLFTILRYYYFATSSYSNNDQVI